MRAAWSLSLVLLAACTDRVVYQADVAVPEAHWDRSYTPEFKFLVKDTVRPHDVYIDVRHTSEYPYQDLYLFVDLWDAEGRHLRDTVDCLLADPAGRWLGKGTGFIHADRYEAHVLYRYRDRFPRPDPFTVRLEQAMRVERLPGILDVGISVERSAVGE